MLKSIIYKYFRLYTIESSKELGKLLSQCDIQNVNYILLSELIDILKKFGIILTNRECLLLCSSFHPKVLNL